ncbi:MAG: hypothetical protein ABSA86_01075 [Oryzomonas sp.]|jgi:sulfatase maturation enzyme AslB (radical SAM superfamily)
MTARLAGHNEKNATVRVVPVRRGQRRFSAMFKPNGSRCNLDFRYCYYLGKGSRHVPQAAGDAILDAIIRDYIYAIYDSEK